MTDKKKRRAKRQKEKIMIRGRRRKTCKKRTKVKEVVTENTW